LEVGSNVSTNVTSHATYNLSGGIFQSIQSPGNPFLYLYPVKIGASHAFGTLNVSGGVFDTQSGGITVLDPAGGVSGINLSGGTISTAALVMADWSRLTFTGGTLNLTGGDVGSATNTGNLIVGGSGSNATLNQYFLAGHGPIPTVTTVG